MNIVKFFTYNNYLLEALANQTLFFNNIYNFNDPFEGLFRYKASSNYDDFVNFLQAHFPELAKHAKHYFENKIEFEKILNRNFEWRYKNNAVCCFSEESQETDILMWSHYANDHKGICIKFDTEKLEFTPKVTIADGVLITKPKGPFKVKYTYKYLDLDPLQKELDHNSFLTTKFEEWKNEKEERYIAARAGNYLFEKNSLLQITFGLRTSLEAKETIMKLSQGYSNVVFKQISLSENSFDIKIVSV
jgi:hypothetical protein